MGEGVPLTRPTVRGHVVDHDAAGLACGCLSIPRTPLFEVNIMLGSGGLGSEQGP